MRLYILSSVIILAWSGTVVQAGGDSFAAVPGTGWTDISQLESTCSVPGYFTNPADCTKFYNCVDHSTDKHTLLLRYDFECAEGTAFDEANKICNYPGPSGCIESGGGWGWQPGWSKGNGNWQNTVTVNKPSWGTPSRQTYITRVSTTPSPIPSNPRINLPQATRIVHIPTSGWESSRIRTPGTSGIFTRVRVTTEAPVNRGWSDPENSGVFQSARVTTQQGPSVTWGSSRVIPVQTGVFQSARVTPVPQTEWESPATFPVVTQPVTTHTVIERPNGGWSGDSLRVTPRPTPIPANPSLPIRYGVVYSPGPVTPVPTPAPVVSWQSTRISPPPAVAWQSQRITQVSQPQPYNPSLVSWDGGRIATSPSPPPPTPSVEWQGARVTQTQVQEPVRITWSTPQLTSQQINVVQRGSVGAANPSLSNPGPPSGFGGSVRLTQLPSGYAWQSNGPVTGSQSQGAVQPQLSNDVDANPVQAGDFGIVQQVIKEEQGQSGEVRGKSHIQLIYETKERQNENFDNQVQTVSTGQQAQTQTVNEIQQGGPNDNSSPIYEIVPSAGSGIRGRIFVLYAPFNKNDGKRDVPVIEVTVEDDDDDKVESNNNNNQEGYNKNERAN